MGSCYFPPVSHPGVKVDLDLGAMLLETWCQILPLLTPFFQSGHTDRFAGVTSDFHQGKRT